MVEKYWLRVDEEGAVEGPFEPRALSFVEGFTPDSLLSEDREGNDQWHRARDLQALEFLFAPPKPPETQAAPESGPLAEAPVRKPPEAVALLPAPEPEAAAPPKPAAPEPDATEDLLDVMRKISDAVELRKEAEMVTVSPLELLQEPPAPAAPAPEPRLEPLSPPPEPLTQDPVAAPPPLVFETPPAPEPRKAEAKPRRPFPVKTVAALVILAALAGAGYWQRPVLIKKFYQLQSWVKATYSKEQAIQELPPEVKAALGESAAPAPEETPRPEAPRAKKRPRKPAARAAKKEAKPEKLEPLKSQKYLLPGVPAPNVRQ